ncbi:MAG: hypothetical protein ABIL68_14740 [bacterium]
MSGTLFYSLGSSLIVVWGIAHLVPTKKVICGLGDLTKDGRRIAVMTWVSEGFTLIFMGVLMGVMMFAFDGDSYTVFWTARVCAGFLVVVAVLSFFTGARTSVIPMKICPFVKLSAALLLFIGSLYF